MRPRGGPVWRASRGAVRHRRVQTFVIGLVVCLSTLTSVTALGLLLAAAKPFDRAFSAQAGAHAVAVFDRGKVTDGQLAATAGAPGVAAVAGPFAEAGVQTRDPRQGGGPTDNDNLVGRADPGGPVDRVDLWQGRWVAGPGEVVLNEVPESRAAVPDGGSGSAAGPPQLVVVRPDGGVLTLTVVGYAYSVSGSADGWVTPGQVAALNPAHTEMLYRFTSADTAARTASATAAATAGLPPGALLGTQSWLATKASSTAKVSLMIPIMTAFGLLGVAVAVLIVLNVVGGAVVAGTRDIGVFKAIGFTPRQVRQVYLATMSVPAVIGTAVGLPLGHLLATPLLAKSFRQFGTPVGVSPLAELLCGLGVPLTVLLAAYVPARRASRMAATAAITAGSAPRAGRGLAVQRRLAGSRLPRSMSLGLGLPFARPGRSALTMAAVLLGVTTVTFANGLARTLDTFSTASDRNAAVGLTLNRFLSATPGQPGARHSGAETLALLRATPGVDAVAATAQVQGAVVGSAVPTSIEVYDGDSARMGYVVPHGHWLDGPGQTVVSARYLNRTGARIGDVITLQLGANQARVTVVGETVTGSDHLLYTGWDTLAKLDPARDADFFEIRLRPGTDAAATAAALRAADPGFGVQVRSAGNPNTVFVVFASTFTVLLSAVAALGVFNTVLLTTRERRRDLGMLKAVGMTPRQVTTMVVTSMTLLGLIGGTIGLPLGYALHRFVMPIMARGSQVGDLTFMMDVYSAPLLAWMFLAGVGIAVLGAVLPARSAARLTISEVLHNE